MAEANACCNRLSEWAWQTQTFGQYALHKARYAHERAALGLTVQVVVRCNAKVADAYKLDKKIQRVFGPDGVIAYDDRSMATLKVSANRMNAPSNECDPPISFSRMALFVYKLSYAAMTKLLKAWDAPLPKFARLYQRTPASAGRASPRWLLPGAG